MIILITKQFYAQKTRKTSSFITLIFSYTAKTHQNVIKYIHFYENIDEMYNGRWTASELYFYINSLVCMEIIVMQMTEGFPQYFTCFHYCNNILLLQNATKEHIKLTPHESRFNIVCFKKYINVEKLGFMLSPIPMLQVWNSIPMLQDK